MHTSPLNAFIFILIFCGSLLMSQSALTAPVPVDTSTLDPSLRSDTQFGIGISSSVAERPFVGVNNQITSLPYIVLSYKDVYIEGLNIGYKLWKKKKLSVEVLATPRFYEVKSSFASDGELDGIDRTNPTYLLGLSTQYRSDFATFTWQLLGDIAESEGFESVVSGSKAFKINDTITLAPALGVTYQNANFVDHFYGVQKNEVKVNRPEYEGNDSINYHLSITTLWKANKNVQLLAQVKYEELGSGTTNSPIIDKDNIVTAVIAAMYLF